MDYDIFYTMLFTDQGMGNLITITETGKTAVLFTALIDFGSAHSTLTGETVAFMKDYISANRAAKKSGYDLDLVVMSHQDNDHWNLFPKLITALPDLTIGRFIYGGDPATFTQGAKDVVAQLKGLVKGSDKSELPLTETSSFATSGGATKPFGPFAQFPEKDPAILLLPVIANVVTDSSARDIKNNTVSIMVGVFWVKGNNAVLLPGDLTSCTLRSLVKLDAAVKSITGTTVLSIPHHGSHRTLSDNYAQEPGSRTFEFAKWFAGSVKPSLVGASAGFASHRHPYELVIQLFAGNVFQKVEEHPYVSYDETQGKYVTQKKIIKGIYTNYNETPSWVETTSASITKEDKIKAAPELSNRIIFKITKTETAVMIAPVKSTPGPGVAQ